MTTFFSDTKKCAVCGKEHKYNLLGSTNAMGPCDLDLRPPEMQRSTMRLWLESCPFCGYVSGDIRELPEGASLDRVRDIIGTKEYKSCEGVLFENTISPIFYKNYMLAVAFGDVTGAFRSLLRAAWGADDSMEKENAKLCREKALPFLEKMIAETPENDNLRVLKADVLRRSGNFGAVVQEYDTVVLQDDFLNRIIRFQVERARAQDDGCYTVAQV